MPQLYRTVGSKSEKPLPNVPIPGKMSLGGGKRGVFKCKICGKKYNTKEEHDFHLQFEHEPKK